MNELTSDEKLAPLRTLAIAVYALQAAGFFVGITWVVAVVINYIKREEVAGTWLESHFSWQIRTFWYALLWALIVALVSLPLAVILVGIGTWVAGLFILGVWAIYRIARGWLRLQAHQSMPMA